MKTVSILKAALPFLVVCLLAGCASTEEGVTSIGNISKTECDHTTRSSTSEGNAVLKLTREGSAISGELLNYKVYCHYEDLMVDCLSGPSQLSISVAGDIPTACICRINIYFTVFDYEDEEFDLSLNGRPLGRVSFQGKKVIQIDLESFLQSE